MLHVTITKHINSRWKQNVNLKSKIINVLEENTGLLKKKRWSRFFKKYKQS